MAAHVLDADLLLLTEHVQVIAPTAAKAGVKVAVVADVPVPIVGLTSTPVVVLQVPFAGMVTFVQSAV